MRGDRALVADQGTGKRSEKYLSNSPKRVGADRQLCCNGLIIRYDYQLQQNESRIYDCTQTDNNKWYTPVDQRVRDTQDSLYQSFRQYTKRGTLNNRLITLP
jgi:hypothetical protein